MQKCLPWMLILLWAGGCVTSPIIKSIPPEQIKSESVVVHGAEAPMFNASRLPDHEKLTYEVRWLGMPIGTLTASIKGRENIGGKETYVLEALAKTNTFFSKIHKIDSRFVSFLDVEKLQPGDILVFRYKNSRGTETGGHVMVVMDKPERASDVYFVRVADSAPSRHSEDTRHINESGIGIGTLLLKANPKTGKPSAFAWGVNGYWNKNVKFAMARPIEV